MSTYKTGAILRAEITTEATKMADRMADKTKISCLRNGRKVNLPPVLVVRGKVRQHDRASFDIASLGLG
jgi:hypothetical protein